MLGPGRRACVVEGEPGAVGWCEIENVANRLTRGILLLKEYRGPFRLTSNVLYPLTDLKQKVGFVTFQELPNELTHWEEWVVLPTSYLHTGTHILAAGSTGFWSLTAVCQPPLFRAEPVL